MVDIFEKHYHVHDMYDEWFNFKVRGVAFSSPWKKWLPNQFFKKHNVLGVLGGQQWLHSDKVTKLGTHVIDS